jgi:hypothetical protein
MIGVLFNIVNAVSKIRAGATDRDCCSATQTRRRQNESRLQIQHNAAHFIGESRMALSESAVRQAPTFTQPSQNAESFRRLEQDKGVHRQRLGMLLPASKGRKP